MKAFVFIALSVVLLVGCRKAVPSDPQPQTEDSLEMTVLDSLPADTTNITPPKKADGLFDDFVFSFMKNPKFQLSRICFPLPEYDDGKCHEVSLKAWHYDPMYLKQDFYTVLFDSEHSMKAEKDTSLDSVVVEWVYLKQNKVKQYVFERMAGVWHLTKIVRHSLSANVNSDFYRFYARFSSDQHYQMAHVSDPLPFKTYDEDNFRPIEGVLGVEQWPDFRPELPNGMITNINYGQHYANSKRRVMVIATPSGGMGCRLVFERGKRGWNLVKYVN